MRGLASTGLALLALLVCVPAARAGVAAQALRQTFTDYCSREARLDARQQDQLLQLAAAAREELERSPGDAAIVARAGLDLQRFGQRYSHAGIALREGTSLPWAVRQLYYACDERRPRLFDQGLAGFVMGGDDPQGGFVRLLLLPAGETADALQQAARDTAAAGGLVAGRYSANAHAWSTQYQNCNQWLAELIGEAWAPGPPRPDGAAADRRRDLAQQSLRQMGYRPARFEVGALALWAARWVPLLHLDDHPPDDIDARQLHISMPTSIEALLRERLPGLRVVELCRDGGQLVVRRDGPPMGERCEPGAGDEVRRLD